MDTGQREPAAKPKQPRLRGQAYAEFIARSAAEVRALVEGPQPQALGEHPGATMTEFLRIRAAMPDGTWVGISSTALIKAALVISGGPYKPEYNYIPYPEFPADYEDLDRCEQTYRLLPKEQRKIVLPFLKEFRSHIESRWGPRSKPVRELSPDVAAAFGLQR